MKSRPDNIDPEMKAQFDLVVLQIKGAAEKLSKLVQERTGLTSEQQLERAKISIENARKELYKPLTAAQQKEVNEDAIKNIPGLRSGSTGA